MANNFPFIFGAGGGQAASASAQPFHTPTTNIHDSMPPQTAASLAGADFSVLDGISPEQFHMIARLVQSGALQLPPPAPGAPPHLPAVAPAPATPAKAKTNPAHTHNQDVDKAYDGEVESESSEKARGRDFLRPPPTGPRSRSVTPRGLPGSSASQQTPASKPSPAARHPGKSKPHQTGASQVPQVNGNTHRGVDPDSDMAVKAFVLELIKCGCSFERISNEVAQPEQLVRMIKELGLEVPPDYASRKPRQVNGIKPKATQQAINSPSSAPQSSVRAKPVGRDEYIARLQATTQDKPKDSANTSAPPSKPVTRDEYLARLQAAKKKKADSPTDDKVSPQPSQPPPVTAPTSETAIQPPVAPNPIDKTALIRQRLEELRAKHPVKSPAGQAASSPTANSSRVEVNGRQAVSSPTRNGLGSGLADIALHVAGNVMDPRSRQEFVAATQNLSEMALPPTQRARDMNFSQARADLLAATENLAKMPLPPRSNNPITTSPQEDLASTYEKLLRMPIPQPLNISTRSQSAAPQGISPTPPTPSRGGLPGLFMLAGQPPSQQLNTFHPAINSSQGLPRNPPTHVEASPAIPKTSPFVASRKRPVASDFDDITAKPTAAKRPFGQSRGNSEDEEMIIEVSEDEEDDDPMETEHVSNMVSQTGLRTKSFRDVGPLRDFPPRPTVQGQLSSPATPGSSTPGGIAYEQKMKELEELKRRLAEKESRLKTNGKSAPATPPTRENVVLSPVAAQAVIVQDSLDPSITTAAASDPASALPHSAFPGTANTSLAQVSEVPERPTSATHAIQQQEVHPLETQMHEFEKDEMYDVDNAIETAVDEQDLAVSDSLRVEHQFEDTAQPLTEDVEQDNFARNSDGEGSEDGEIDESAFAELYDPHEHTDVPAFRMGNGQISSQATTMTPTSGSDHASHIAVAVPVEPISAQTGSNSQDETRDEEVQMDTHMHEHSAAPHDDSASEESMDEDDESDDDSEDDGDLDNLHNSPQHVLTTATSRPIVSSSASDDEKSDGEVSSDASMSDNEDYEPEPAEMDAMGRADDLFEDDVPATISATTGIELAGDAADDGLASELQPTDEQQDQTHNRESPEPQVKSRFTPYRSALYSGGHRSLTYSNNIDASIPFCPYESSGGKCNDDDCVFQHFRSL